MLDTGLKCSSFYRFHSFMCLLQWQQWYWHDNNTEPKSRAWFWLGTFHANIILLGGALFTGRHISKTLASYVPRGSSRTGPGSRWRPSTSSTPSRGSTAVSCFGVHPTLFRAVGPPAVDRQTRTVYREILGKLYIDNNMSSKYFDRKATSPPHVDGSVVFARLHQPAPRLTCFFGPTCVHTPNGISINSAIFAQLAAEGT